MGPMMLSHNDSRPGEGGHDADWRDNVMPYIKKMHTIEYWRQDDKLTNIEALTGDDATFPILYIRFFELSDDHDYTMRSVFKQASETAKAMNLPWGLYYNAFLQGDIGRHVATVNFYKNWTDLDSPQKWKETYEGLYGENTWDNFIDTVNGTFKNQWDEIWVKNEWRLISKQILTNKMYAKDLSNMKGFFVFNSDSSIAEETIRNFIL